MSSKSVRRVLSAPEPHWVGDGFLVHPLFADAAFTAEISPFLMFDWAPPRSFAPSGSDRGVGPHPHRGMETVTIVDAGEVVHRDSAGNSGQIGPGDVQWMTAGAGILHEEMHGETIAEAGGVVSMAQLWVNLPARAKATPPRYQAIAADRIPVVAFDGGRVRVIAGPYGDATGAVHRGPAETHTPLAVWDVTLEAGATFSAAIPAGWRTLAAVTRGAATIGERLLGTMTVAILGDEDARLAARAGPEGARLLVLAGEPIDEPIAAAGPFVMTTRAELVTAFEDFRRGRMGVLEPRGRSTEG